MKNFKKRVISIFIVIAMMLTDSSIAVFANDAVSEISEIENVQREETIPSVDNEVDAYPVVEVENYRTFNQKRFLMSDKSVQAVIYSEPVHYEENGQYLDIDTTLKYEKAVDDSDVNGFVSKNGDFDVKFAQESDAGKLIAVRKDKYELSWNYRGNEAELQNSSVEIKGKGKPKSLIEESIINSSQAVNYNNISDNVDLQYIFSGTGLKENIVIKDKKDEYSYTFDIAMNNLELKINKDILEAYDKETNEVVFEIPAAYMYDSRGIRSNSVFYELTEKDDRYSLKVIADPEWLNSDERVFPVVIDPQVVTKQLRNEIASSYVVSGYPYEVNHGIESRMTVGKDSAGSGEMRSLIKFTLPALNKGDMVVDATMSLGQIGVYYYASTTPDAAINAYIINGTWTKGNVCWNNQPSLLNSYAIDYAMANKSEAQTAVQKNWNITKAVKGWYEGTVANNGIMLKSAVEDVSDMAQSCIYANYYTEDNSVTSGYPIISIVYRNNKGLEDYWTYTNASAGMAGNASVNDYSGNLVFTSTDLSTSGLLMPVTIERVYNGYMANKKYEDVKPYVGRGWKLNIQQTVRTTDMTNYPYVYEDGDGTAHYFYKKSDSEIFDEDGLGLKIERTSTGYTISDEKDQKMFFNSIGNLRKIVDSNGNYMEITYASDNKTITSVKDGSGHVITLTRNSNDYLTRITDAAGRNISYSYIGTYPSLGTVTYPDSTTSTYTYDSDNALQTAYGNDGIGLVFYYTSLTKGKRITQITEKNFSESKTGQTVKFSRANYNETAITTSGVDCRIDTDDDVTTVYQFDNFGRTKLVYSKTSSGYLNATSYSYTSAQANSSASNIKQLNRVSREGSFGKICVNFAKNTSFETDNTGWTYADWGDGTITQTHSRATNFSLFGNASYKFTVTQTSGGAGARIYQNYTSPYVKAGSKYTLSAYVKTEDVQSAGGNGGACVALYINSDSGSSTVYSDFITGTTSTSVNDGWQRISATVTIPSDFNYLRANLSLKNATGTAYFDGIQVDNSSVVNNYNFVENSSFQVNSSGTPNNWNMSGGTESLDGVQSSNGLFGTNLFKFTGESTKDKQIFQTVKIKGTESSTYVLSGWAKGNSVAANEKNSNRKFELVAEVKYSDGTSVYKSPAYFNTTVSSWQYTAVPFNLSDGTSEVKTPISITVCVRYYGQANSVYFDGIQLTQEPTASYIYDSKGNVISVAQNAKNKATMEYSNSDLISATDAKGYNYTYSHDANHNITMAKSQNNVKYKYTYNNKGEATALDITNNAESLAIGSSIKYTNADTANAINAGAYINKTYDQNNNATTYNYNLQKGTLASVTDAKGNTTSYTYNANNDAMQSVTSGGITTSYNYDSNGRFSAINHNSTQYGFTYDAFGKTLTTAVGNRTLSRNQYTTYNGDLERIIYGNSDIRDYTYNVFGQLSTEKVDNTLAYKWGYTTSGTNISHTDLINQLKYTYEYDSIDRLARQHVYDTTTSNLKYASEYGYDLKNNVSRFTNVAGGRSFTQNYTYEKDNLPSQYRISSTRNHTYSYDSLNRLKSIVLSTTTPVNIDYYYNLSSGRNATGETKYRTTQLNTEYIGDKAYRYLYDKLGNITTIQEGVRAVTDGSTSMANKITVVTYTYDSLNQLKRENNLYNNQTIVYNYDNGGNITSKVIYPYTTASDLSAVTPTETITYQYGDSGWKDLLTSYNGQSFVYDTIGNPTTYRGNTLTWSGGRNLASFSNADNSIAYTYDANGYRATKTVNGIKSTYEYVGDQLVYEKRGNMDIYYFYDSYGNLSAIRYANGTVDNIYYSVCNSRGDVEAFYNGSGTLKSRYIYDSWGNVIKVVNANGVEITNQNDVAFINPIRYRGYYYDSETGFYYLKSRYYDPEVGRFINADGYVSTGQGVLGNNMFAYCNNNPVMYCDPTGESLLAALVVAVVTTVVTLSGCTSVNPEPYKSADDAAKAFSENTYGSSSYIRHEYGTEIYSRTINGKTTYNYNPPRVGDPHSVTVGHSTPEGTTIVAYAHTHPNSNDFSPSDKAIAIGMQINAYVVGPSLELKLYDFSSLSTTDIGVVSPIPLTDAQRDLLVSNFRISWDSHFNNGVCPKGFKCENKSWPNG